MTTYHSNEQARRALLGGGWESRGELDLTVLGNIPIGTTPGALPDMLGDGVDWALIDRNGDLSALSVVSGSGIAFSHAAQSSTWGVREADEECPILSVLIADYMADYSSLDDCLIRAKLNRNSVDGLGERAGIAIVSMATGLDVGYGVTVGNDNSGTANLRTQRQQGSTENVREFDGGDFVTDDEIIVLRPAVTAAAILAGRGAGAGTPGGAWSDFGNVEFVGQQNSNASNVSESGAWDPANDLLYLTFQALNTDGDAVMYLERLEFFRRLADWQNR